MIFSLKKAILKIVCVIAYCFSKTIIDREKVFIYKYNFRDKMYKQVKFAELYILHVLIALSKFEHFYKNKNMWCGWQFYNSQ